MKRSLNKLHYGLYVIETKLHFLFNKINPGLLLYRIPWVKKRMKNKYGINNTKEWLDDFWLDKKNGLSIINIGGWLVGLIVLLFISSAIFLGKLLSINIINNNFIWLCFGFLTISWALCHFCVFKNDIYLKYFDEFEKWSTFKKRTNVLQTVGLILLVIIFFFVSLLYFPK